MLSSHDDVLSGLERGTLDSLAIRGNAAGEKEGAVNRRNCSLSNVCGGERESMIAPMSSWGW